MSEGGFSFGDAFGLWRNVRDQRAETEPERLAKRAAFDAVRPLAGRPNAEIRAALVAEHARRDISNLTPLHLDLLVEAVQTSLSRAVARAGRNQVKALANLWRELK